MSKLGFIVWEAVCIPKKVALSIFSGVILTILIVSIIGCCKCAIKKRQLRKNSISSEIFDNGVIGLSSNGKTEIELTNSAPDTLRKFNLSLPEIKAEDTINS